jgi:hypothetical protein
LIQHSLSSSHFNSIAIKSTKECSQFFSPRSFVKKEQNEGEKGSPELKEFESAFKQYNVLISSENTTKGKSSFSNLIKQKTLVKRVSTTNLQVDKFFHRP